MQDLHTNLVSGIFDAGDGATYEPTQCRSDGLNLFRPFSRKLGTCLTELDFLISFALRTIVTILIDKGCRKFENEHIRSKNINRLC